MAHPISLTTSRPLPACPMRTVHVCAARVGLIFFFFFEGSSSPAATSGFGAGEGSSNNNSSSSHNNANGNSSAGASDAPGAAGGGASADDAAATGPLAGVDEETRGILKKAGLAKIPTTAADWARFERAKKGKKKVCLLLYL